jgi:hypothetical protein
MTSLLSNLEQANQGRVLEGIQSTNYLEEMRLRGDPGNSGAEFGHFTDADVRAFQNDDAMTGSMVGVILGIAFTVLLGLVTAVNIWTSYFAIR